MAGEQDLSEPGDMQAHGKAVSQRTRQRPTLFVQVLLENQTVSVQWFFYQVIYYFPDLWLPLEEFQPRSPIEELLILKVAGTTFLPNRWLGLQSLLLNKIVLLWFQ